MSDDCYTFIPGPEDCKIESYTETLGRALHQSTADLLTMQGLIFRSIVADPTLNGVWSVSYSGGVATVIDDNGTQTINTSSVTGLRDWLAANTSIRMVATDHEYPSIVGGLSSSLTNFSVTLTGAGGRPLVPSDTVRTGPVGALIHIQSSENPDPNSDGSPILVQPPESVLIFNCDELVWEFLDN